LVVRYAPQLEIVKRAAAVITHAGLNTVLESLAEGVPLVALPLGNDQPGVAARVRAHGAAVVIPQQKLTAGRLRRAVRAVLENPAYRHSARKLQAAFQQVDGLNRAADIIEEAFGIGAQRADVWMDSVAAD
jgi:MGT family glycosyltransferase